MLAVEDILEQIVKLKSQKVSTTINTDELKGLKVTTDFTKILKSELQDIFKTEFGIAGKHVHLKFQHHHTQKQLNIFAKKIELQLNIFAKKIELSNFDWIINLNFKMSRSEGDLFPPAAPSDQPPQMDQFE